jgi:hypothetical protein
MWFWINFSPIGQAPPAPKKSSDLQDDKDLKLEPDAKIEGSFSSLILSYIIHFLFRRKKIR